LCFGFVSARRILPVYWGALRFLNKIVVYLSKKKNLMIIVREINTLGSLLVRP
jgi:hypothetical protein